MKALLLRPDRAGDAIKTLPVLRALRAKHPEIEISLIVSEHNQSLFVNEPGIKISVLPVHWKRMKPENLRNQLIQNGLAQPVDKLVNLLCDPFEEVERLLLSIPAEEKYSVASIHGGMEPFWKKLELPMATPQGRDESTNIAILVSQALGIPLLDRIYHFSSAPLFTVQDETEAFEVMGGKHGPWLGFCPFAGTAHRTLPVRRWQKFLYKVTKEESFEKYFLFGLPSDYKQLQDLKASAANPDQVELCFPSSFRTLGAYLKRLDGVVAVDSGPLHLARALGIKTLGILSGGDAARWFANISQGEHFLKRGLFQRFPSSYEILRAFEKWKPEVTNALHAWA